MRFLIFFMFLLSLKVQAGNDSNINAKKAKFISHLLEIIEWPNLTLQDKVSVCVLGKNSTAEVNALDGKTINHRTITVKKINSLKKVENACQLVYITKKPVPFKEMSNYSTLPILWLGDMEHFAADGGSMNFTTLNGILALTVNLETLKKSNLPFNINDYGEYTVIPELNDVIPKNP